MNHINVIHKRGDRKLSTLYEGNFMWTALDIFIGLTLCYALVSLFCSAIQEFIAQAFNSRGKFLIKALENVNLSGIVPLIKPDLVTMPFWIWKSASRAIPVQTMTPEQIKDLQNSSETASRDERIPHEIPADLFARVVLANLALLAKGKLVDDPATAIKAKSLPKTLETRLLAGLSTDGATVDKIVDDIKGWYEHFMIQVEQWYTRRAQVISLIIGMAVAFALNVDTIAIAKSLREDDSQRALVVAMAQTTSKDGKLANCPDPAAASASQVGKEARTDKNAIDKIIACQRALEDAYPYPLGWPVDQPFSSSCLDWISKIVGILLSGLALSLGSRFWFDTLKNLLALRTGGPSKTAKADK